MNPPFVNISAYKFVPIDNPAAVKEDLLPLCRSLGLKGTVLVSTEGINMFVAGTRKSIDDYLKHLQRYRDFDDLPIKESLSDHQPFSRMLVRLKKEIISMGVESIKPAVRTSPKLKASELKQWLDDGKEITLLDVRNDYEVEVGTFRSATPIGVDHFRKFPEAIKSLPEESKQKPVVMFCTGGIRCEKAGPLMQGQGFEHVYQLDGGILRYFEEVGGEHYDGDCFVFDKRVAVDPTLAETDAQQCYACQTVLTIEDQRSDFYHPPHSCPYCFRTPEQKRAQAAQLRTERIRAAISPLPGSVAYDNVRPMNVPLRFDQKPAIDFLVGMHANLDDTFWRERLDAGRITYKEQPITADTVVRSGWRIEHLTPQATEPPVSDAVTILYEDEAIVVVDKPAPLPMHPCGRFNRNTLGYFLSQAYNEHQLRQTHRLDANTTGVVVYATKKRYAQAIFPQFQNATVEKTYLARVLGHFDNDRFVCDQPISDQASTAGTRIVSPDGRSALTEFEVIERLQDGTSLVICRPKTGRTNQIRIHLAHLGFPIKGDAAYCVDHDQSVTQTSSPTDPPMCLHAWKIRLDHPETGQRVAFEAQCPDWANAAGGQTLPPDNA
jgi:RluA family pseudouridine synthase